MGCTGVTQQSRLSAAQPTAWPVPGFCLPQAAYITDFYLLLWTVHALTAALRTLPSVVLGHRETGTDKADCAEASCRIPVDSQCDMIRG